jgi:hypothetical protein
MKGVLICASHPCCSICVSEAFHTVCLDGIKFESYLPSFGGDKTCVTFFQRVNYHPQFVVDLHQNLV